MFHKNKRQSPIQPISKKMENESGVIVNKSAAMAPRDNKVRKQGKSDMPSQDECK